MATRYDALRRVALFGDFSDTQCDALAAVLRPRRVAAGTIVFEQGAPGDTMVVVVEGRLAVDLKDRRGKHTIIGEMLPGEIVGDMAVIDPAPRSATIRAASDVLIYELNRDGLRQLRDSSPAAAAAITSAIIQGVTRRLRQVDERIEKRLHPAQPTAAAKRKDGAVGPPQKEEHNSVFSRIWSRLSGD